MSLRRLSPISVVTLCIALCLILFSSCNESKRHEVLSFLFDGVPPLPGDEDPLGAEEGAGPARRRPETVWFVHDPLVNYDPSLERSCIRCHGEKTARSFSSEVQLVSPTPLLCFECHDPPTFQEGWIHGPVAAGECVFCHEPHRSPYKYLLKRAQPAVCYQCHDSQAIAEIENHAKSTYTQCTDCHSGHASTAKYLLKVGSSLSAERTQSQPTGLAPFDALLKTARVQVQQGQGLPELLRIIEQYAEQAAFPEARAFLLALRMDRDYSKRERLEMLALEERLDAAEQMWQESHQQARDQRSGEIAQLYYQSINAYHAGDLEQARQGFVRVSNSDLVPDVIRQAIQEYINTIDYMLSGAGKPRVEPTQ